MMIAIKFDRKNIESDFEEAEKILLNLNKVTVIKFEDFNHESFDVNNQDFLNEIAQNPIVYCIWTGPTERSLKPKYIGHVGKKYSRQRIRNHLTKKHKKTGAQLKNTILALKERHIVGISYVITEPHYMRKALEDWLIAKHSDNLIWNKAGKTKSKTI